MATRLAIATLALFACAVSAAGASERERCGTRLPSNEEMDQIEQRLSRVKARGGAATTIPVWVHVISRGKGFDNGQLPEGMIRAQIRVLNDSYLGATGGAHAGFSFELAGITRTANRDWFERLVTDFEVEVAGRT